MKISETRIRARTNLIIQARIRHILRKEGYNPLRFDFDHNIARTRFNEYLMDSTKVAEARTEALRQLKWEFS